MASVSGWAKTALCLGLIAATFVAMAAISWFRWPELLVDYGRELYVPWRISDGEMLYKDIPHLYGPLAHYVNALLFTLFGVSLRTLVFFNLLLIGLLSICIYGIFHRTCDRLTATLCGLVFLGVFAFSRNTGLGNWNFVCPYSHEVTYGISLSFLLIPALERFHERRNRFWAMVAGFLLGLVFLTKVEVFVAALLATIAVVSLPVIRRRSLRDIGWGKLLFALGGLAVPLLGFIALFSSRMTIAAAAGMVATTVTSLGKAPIVRSPLYLYHAGLDEPLANVLTMLAVAAIYGGLFIGVVLLTKVFARRGGANRNPLLLAATVLALVAFACVFKDRTEWWSRAGRAFPLFVLAHVCFLLWRWARGSAGPEDSRKMPLILALSVFGFFLLLKILLRAQFDFYGSVLAMPATLVVVAHAAHALPEYARRRGGCKVTAKVVVATLVILFVALQAEMSRTFFRRMTYPVGHGADRFYTFDADFMENGPIVAAALKAIETTMPQDAGFVVIPEGVMLNYLTRHRNPGRWFEFTPQFVVSMGEERMRADLETARPEYLVLTERPTPEHGAEYFGTDYGFGLKGWIMDNYTPVYLAGSKLFSNQGFGIAIARRNEKTPPGR